MTGAEQKRGAQTEKPRPEIARRQCHDHAQPAGAAGGNGEARRVGVQADAREAAPGQHRGQAVRPFVGQRHYVARARPRHRGEHQYRRNHGETQNDRRRRRRLAGERSPPHFSHDDLHAGRSSTARRGHPARTSTSRSFGLVSSAAGNVGLTTAMCSRDRPPPGAPDGRDNGLISGASRLRGPDAPHAVPRLRFLLSKAGIEGEGNGVRSARLWAGLLGLAKVVVEDVEFDEVEQVLVVSARPRKATKRRCGRCGKRCSGYDQGEGRRRWRTLDFGQVRAFLEADSPRVRCAEHGVIAAQVPWARHGAGHTYAFDDTAAWLVTHCSKSAVRDLLRIAWRTVGSIVTRVVADAEATTDRFANLRRIGIDEISYKRGHKYLTVIVDHDTGVLLWARPGPELLTWRVRS